MELTSMIKENAEPVILWYYPDDNFFSDEDGHIVYNIFEYISPSQLMLFKERKEYTLVYNDKGKVVELNYPEFDFERSYEYE